MRRSASPASRAISNRRPNACATRSNGRSCRAAGPPLAQAYSSRNIAPPPALLNAIERMMPMLRFFRHSDGTFAHFNGMGATPAELLLTLFAYEHSRGAPLSNAPHSGYQRVETGGGVLIMDTGRAPPVETSL